MPVLERTPAESADGRRALLARRLKALTAEDTALAIPPRSASTPVRISVDQYRIWLHHSMHPALPLYNEPVSIFHDGPLDPALVARALGLYAARHEAWRTGFQSVGDQVLQQVSAAVTVPVPFHDLRWMGEAQALAEDERLARANAVEPFDLTCPPLFRATLVRVSAGQDRLHLVVHHLIFDGTAVRDSLVPELTAIYEALAQGRGPALTPLALQYPDFAAWREQELSSPAIERATEFWRERLSGDLPVPRLPIDRPRPATISQRGEMLRFTFSAELTQRLRALGSEHRATLYLVLLASLHALLFRYSGQNDGIIGTASNGRTRPEWQGMMGYILDTFPVRVRPAASQTFLDLLRATRTELFCALDAAAVPFDRIVQAAGARRDSSCHPVFQTFFSFPPTLAQPAQGWQLQPKIVDTGTAKFDLYFEVEECGEGTAGCLLFNTDVFDAATAQRIVGHWTTLLEAIVSDPHTTLDALPLLSPAEQQRMLVDWNSTGSPVPPSTMHDLFTAQARSSPDRIAVEFGKRRLTYAQLNDRAERFAFLLQEAGARPGSLVVLCIDRSEDLLASLLGILKTGATYLPLDPGTPLARITACLEDAEPTVLLTQRSMVERLPRMDVATLLIEDLLPAASALPAGSGVAEGLATPADSAYIIHTSGSTGKPKAVELTHAAAVNLLLSFAREPGMTAADVLVAVTTISFDIAVLELFLPILTGARVVIAPRSTALDPFELSDLLEASGCTVVQATPATWRALMAIDWPGVPGLKVLSGGEALSRDLGEKLLARNVELWNVYGPTETCIWSTAHRVQTGTGGIPIGRPIANTTTFILDAQQQPVPVGVVGELYIGGLGLAKGYRGQPHLTAEKFVTLPIANGQRVYRTGDYAVYRADGTIECQGRADNQVKVRGYRIELEEVELHLSAYPEAASAAARVWKDEDAGNRLTGYLVARPGSTIDIREVRRFLQGRLAEYMIPTQLLVLDEMPLTPNGKTDRKALPESLEQQAVAAPASETMSATEERLAKIWCELLKLTRVARSDNFFALGGHSLLLVRLFTRINREFGTNLPLTAVFDAQTLAALGDLLECRTRISSLVPVKPKGSKPPLFMAHSYLLYHGLSGVLADNQPVYGLREVESDGELSITARALLYCTDMRTVQPHGPYRVAGWCAAAPLAVEIARQLLLRGEQVQSLLLFDAWLPDYYEEMQSTQARGSYAARLAKKLAVYRAKSAGLTLAGKLGYVTRVARRIGKQKRDAFYTRHRGIITLLSERLHVPLPQFMHNTSLQTLVAMQQFQPDLLPVEITLLRARDSQPTPAALAGCGWERVAGKGVRVQWVCGDHETMFQGDNLKQVGAVVQATLDTRLDAEPVEAFAHARAS